MTAVCGICVSNAVDENCYILMPGCGHVFDRACIINSLGVEYTCPECQNNYLLPSPYRPFQLSDSTDFVEYKELHKRLMQANTIITQLKEELAKAYEDLSLEQRSRKKSNESLFVLSQQLVALQDECNNLSSNETSHLSVAVTSQEDEAFSDLNVTSSEIQANIPSPKTPVPTETTEKCEEKIADKQPDDKKEKFLIHYNTRIQELTIKMPNVHESQKQSMDYYLRLCIESKVMVEKLLNLQYISSEITANISYSQSNADRNTVNHRNIVSKLSASIKKAKEMDGTFMAEKQDKIKVYIDKIFELEKAFNLSSTCDLQALKITYQEHDALLPKKGQMNEYSMVPKKHKKLKKKHAKLNSTCIYIKQVKLQEKLEHTLTQSKEFPKKVNTHAGIIKQAEQMNQELEAFLYE